MAEAFSEFYLHFTVIQYKLQATVLDFTLKIFI
jgi:hypothetical protein